MGIKMSILVVSILLMVAIIILSGFGIAWALDAEKTPPLGGRVVLAVSAVAAVLCLWRIWSTRRERLTS